MKVVEDFHARFVTGHRAVEFPSEHGGAVRVGSEITIIVVLEPFHRDKPQRPFFVRGVDLRVGFCRVHPAELFVIDVEVAQLRHTRIGVSALVLTTRERGLQ